LVLLVIFIYDARSHMHQIPCKSFTLTIHHAVCNPPSFCHSQISYALRSKDGTQKTISYALLEI